MHDLEHDVRPPLRPRPDAVDSAVALPSVDLAAGRRVLQPDGPFFLTADSAETWGAQWTAAQAAAVACAEAIAAEAAADVATEAAVTARAAVDAASAASFRATARAKEVAARALLAAAAAAREMPLPHPLTGGRNDQRAASAATAAARVSGRVAAVAAAAATAALKAQELIREQLVKDESALALQLLRDAGVGTPGPAAAVVADPLVVAEELRYGIGAEQLRLHYQPIMSLVSGQPVGVEALVRWQHPERGLLAPVQFLDVAEDSGLVLSLGEWVLHEACRMAVSLQGRSDTPLTVAVNLSGRQLSDSGLVATVQAALDAHGCSADRLVFEVTETALVTDMAAAVDSLRELQRLGAGVALDDFGTGHAPLLYLKQLGADDLKIDRSFVNGLGVDACDSAVVASLISLAHNLGLRCVAEGVETLKQFELLQQLGCDFAQGYLFCRPLDAASLALWLDRRMVERLGAGLAEGNFFGRPDGLEAPPAPTAERPAEVRSEDRISGPGPSAEAAAVAAAMFTAGSSTTTVAAALNARRLTAPSGRRWHPSSVKRLLAG